jgi:DNA-directed RNA polymerase specialized sigma24 family protein
MWRSQSLAGRFVRQSRKRATAGRKSIQFLAPNYRSLARLPVNSFGEEHAVRRRGEFNPACRLREVRTRSLPDRFQTRPRPARMIRYRPDKMSGQNQDGDGSWRQPAFVTTRWSLIVRARGEGKEAVVALEQLCRDYWPPLFIYARRQGLSPHDAQDAVQGFIAHLLERKDLAAADQEKGRFRSYLLTAFKHFLISQARGENSMKRGGSAVSISLDTNASELHDAPELTDAATPDKAYDRSWAQHLMTRALQRLEGEHRTPPQARLLSALRPTLMDGGRILHEAELSAQLGMTPGALAVAATRLRRRYRTLIEEEVKQTLADPSDWQEEMKALWLAWT